MNFLEVYLPITKETFLDVISGNTEAIFSDEYAESILSLLKKSDINGNFCNYKEVLEISLGLESYSPSEFKSVHNIKATAFLDDDINNVKIVSLVEEVIKLHPWEHPVIALWLADFRMLSRKKPSDFILELKSRLQIHDK